MSSVPAAAPYPHWGLPSAFATSGLLLATWGARLPGLRTSAELAPQTIGWVVGCLGAGSTLALFLAGPIVHVLGDLRSIRLGAGLSAAALVLTAGLPGSGLAIMLAAFALGLGNGVYDVAMNARAAAQHRAAVRSRRMAGLHGWFSVGALAGAASTAVLAQFQVRLEAHLAVVAVLTVTLTHVAVPRDPQTEIRWPGSWREVAPRFEAWGDQRTLSLGFLALGAVFAEGAANEWLTTALTDRNGFGLSDARAAAFLAVFAAGMVITRIPVSRRYARDSARPAALALSLALVAAGTGTVIAASLAGWRPGWSQIAVAAGLFAWGSGAALGVPFALAAAGAPSRELGRDPDRSETSDRLGVVQTLGCGFLVVAAPFMSLLGKRVGFIWILAAAPLVMAVGFAASAALHPRGDRFTRQARDQAWSTFRASS